MSHFGANLWNTDREFYKKKRNCKNILALNRNYGKILSKLRKFKWRRI